MPLYTANGILLACQQRNLHSSSLCCSFCAECSCSCSCSCLCPCSCLQRLPTRIALPSVGPCSGYIYGMCVGGLRSYIGAQPSTQRRGKKKNVSSPHKKLVVLLGKIKEHAPRMHWSHTREPSSSHAAASTFSMCARMRSLMTLRTT
jgi:hypothetical protein